MSDALTKDLTPKDRPAAVWRVLFAIPVLGWMARDVAQGGTDMIYYALFSIVAMVVIAMTIWGLPALGLTGLGLVPVVFVLLLLITRG